MHSSATRLLAIASATAVLIAAIGFVAELWRFGIGNAATADRLERDVRARFTERTAQVQSLADRVARETAQAVARADDRPALFDQLTQLVPPESAGSISATIYVPKGPPNLFSILAWSDGPAELVGPDRLEGRPALFVAPGTLGLRLMFVRPIEAEGRRVGSAVAETVLAPQIGVMPGAYRLDTLFGPVTLRSFPGAGQTPPRPGTFVITTEPAGAGMDIEVVTGDLGAARLTFRRRVFATAALPLIAAVLLFTGGILRRRSEAHTSLTFLGWTCVACGVLVGSAAMLTYLCAEIGTPSPIRAAIEGLVALGLVTLVPLSWWWRRPHRSQPTRAPVRFIAEQLAAGVAAAACFWLIARVLHDRTTAATLGQWQFPLFPFDVDVSLDLAGLLLTQLSLYWGAALVLAVVAGRWRVTPARLPLSLAACGLWLLPTVFLLALPSRSLVLPVGRVLIAVGTALLFALVATAVRHRYRHTTQAMRLVVLFSALIVPLVVLYPVAWFYADTTARAVIERDYSAATMARPKEILEELKQAQREIDAIPAAQLIQLTARTAPVEAPIPTLAAFNVWSQTNLSETRATSAIELYGADGSPVSRFALNVPEYRGGVSDVTMKSPVTTCAWDVFGEAVPFGAEERDMLHAQREICDADGRPQGAIVVNVINDYQALPFVSSASPYRDVLRSPDAGPRRSVLTDLQVVVYGWSFAPIFTSGNVAWPITSDLFRRLYAVRDPFWTQLEAEGRAYNVYFSNDRRFVYALGYPAATLFQHLTRLAEVATLTAAIFVLLLLGAAMYAPFARRRSAPLAALFEEIRTSFYRKLFLFFVLAAIGPVLLFALAFGAYMNAKFRADVESEASSVVTVARRVLEQSVGFESQQAPAHSTLNDDVMVWVGQVLHQDVNLFEGPDLVATSQRDLYASGLLPTRTPAKVYHAIALNRLPTFVAEDRIGTFGYLVAAAPIPAAGRDAVLSVPLALRQREIERENDELNRGVLVGAVFVILFAAGLGASVASRISDPVARLSRATRQIAAGKLDVRIVADTADELRRLIDDFNSMAATLSAQRAELARTNQLKAWAEMARQVAHEIKNPLTPIQLAAEHLQHVHEDRNRPLGPVFDQCLTTILRQVRLLRQIASEFSNFAGEPTPRFTAVPPSDLIEEVIRPYRTGLDSRTTIRVDVPATLPAVWVDRTLVARALTNLVENAMQAMPSGGTLEVRASEEGGALLLTLADTGVGMDADAVSRAFEPYFSTKTAGSGLGLANAKRNIERCGGAIAIDSAPGRGTTLRVTLPLEVRSAARETASTPSR